MKKILILSAAVLLAASLSSFFPSADDLSVYDNFIRLHVIANSDTDEDQAQKLEVRDRILELVGERLADAGTKKDAEKKMEDLLSEIEEAAASVVSVRECGYDVRATLSEEKYPRKSYGTVTLPAGKYTSLRVVIGEGAGHNWWCVLFPRMCTRPAVTDEAQKKEFAEAGFTPSQYKIITDSEDTRYVVKFRLIEIIRELFA